MNQGFGLQLNCFPQAGQVIQNQTLNWFQYVLVVGGANDGLPGNDQKVGWAVEYWNTIGPGSWPSGYTPESTEYEPAKAGYPE